MKHQQEKWDNVSSGSVGRGGRGVVVLAVDTCVSSLTFLKARLLQKSTMQTFGTRKQEHSVALDVYSFVKYSVDIAYFATKLAQFLNFQNG